MLITTEHPAALQPQVFRTLRRWSQDRRKGREGASREEFNGTEPTGEDERRV